jgi:uncharacterized membrane protein required for colicin V production
MNITLLLFLIIVAVSAFRGYRSGILVIAARVVSLVLAYLGAILFTTSAAGLLQKHTAIEGLIAYMIAGSLVFIVTSILLSSIFSFLIRHFAEKSTDTNKASSVAGGLFGAVVGCLVGLMAVWFVSTFQEILLAKKGQQIAKSSAFEQTVKKLTSAAIGGIVSGTTSDSYLANGAAKLLSNPAENIQHFNRLTQTGALRNLLQSSEARSALDSQNPAALLNSQAFNQLALNPDFVALTNELNLVENGPQKDKQLAIKITRLWTQIKQVQNNPQYLEIVNDPEIKQMLQSGNAFKLLNSAKIEQLLQIISSSKTPEVVYQESVEQPEKPIAKKAIYRRVDKDGKVHYSDQEKDSEKQNK